MPASAPAATAGHTLTLHWITDATTKYVYADDMRAAVSLALASGQNVILFGRGGHAKSDFLTDAFGAIKGVDPFVKRLGTGTGEDDLYGGIDLDAMNRPDGRVLQYNALYSFLLHGIVIFEEGLDAPARTLTSLKDTLTAKELRNGCQRVPMDTRIIAMPTNKVPSEVAELGADVAALLERFPIQVNVTWPGYSADNFLHMFDTVAAANGDTPPAVTWDQVLELQAATEAVEVPRLSLRVLSHVMEELIRQQVTVSPRTAMMAVRLLKAAAAINGRKRVVPEDINAIRYLPGCQGHAQLITDTVIAWADSLDAEETIREIQETLNTLCTEAASAKDAEGVRYLMREADSLMSSLRGLRNVPFTLVGPRNHVENGIARLQSELQDKLTELEALAAVTGNTTDKLIEPLVDNLRSIRSRMNRAADKEALRQLVRELQDLRADAIETDVPPLHRHRIDKLVTKIDGAITACNDKISSAASSRNGWRR